ncbi:MAG TPA: hypothetical protein PKH10_04855 [bacterium]|nr:hypothetical protein [bacterium]
MWQKLISEKLKLLDAFLRSNSWNGRENEVVNLFAHHILIGSKMTNELAPSQIGIEVAVPQVTGSRKKLVRKDLVIWPEPLMTVWTPGAIPAVIMEWKRDRWSDTKDDIAWLKTFTKVYPGVLGYAVCAFIGRGRGVRYAVISNGRIIEETEFRTTSQDALGGANGDRSRGRPSEEVE